METCEDIEGWTEEHSTKMANFLETEAPFYKTYGRWTTETTDNSDGAYTIFHWHLSGKTLVTKENHPIAYSCAVVKDDGDLFDVECQECGEKPPRVLVLGKSLNDF